tara:strand:+ start:10913 stop:11464 length:552 start_codon:yes stop_codon:yes gene_type:complete
MNEEILTDLKGENSFAFGELYRDYFGTVKRFVISNNGTLADAEDIFQDTMLVLVEKMRQDHFQLTASLKTYIMAISKNLWFKKLRDSHLQTDAAAFDEEKFFEEIDSAIEAEKNYREKVQGYLKKITTHCNRLINDIFFKGKLIEEIQKEYGYSSRHNAINQKHKCISQIRKVKEESDSDKKS